MKSNYLTLVALSAICIPQLSTAADVTRPNIIVMMADDMGFSCISPYGGEIHTPNLQKMADEGLRFTQFYNNAKCTTTRASLLSGMYPRNGGNSIPLGIATAGEQMRAAGYRTALCGKWHLGSKAPQRPIDRGFDAFYGLMDGCCNFFNPAQPDPAAKGGKVRVFGQNDELITEFPPGYYTTDAFTDHAIQAIKQFTGEAKPFFLHLAFTCPHYPLHAPAEDIAKYRGKYKAGWEAMREARYARQKELGLWGDHVPALSGTDSKAYAWEGANQDWEDLRMATYAAMVDRMDQNIGRLLKALDELGIADNTIVMFLSDNGGCTEEPGGRDDAQQPGIVSTYTAVGPSWGWAQNAPFRRYKSWVNEGGISTPLIVRWPGKVKPNSKTDQIGHIIDVVPTCLELAQGKALAEVHGETASPLEGHSLLPIFSGATRPAPAELCWEWGGNCAVRHGKWKLVWDTAAKPVKWELYDLEADRTELHDIAEANPEQVKELTEAYTKWAKATGRKLPGAGKGKKKDLVE